MAGVVGPALGYLAAWRSDKRKFQHERGLKATEDLVGLLDDVLIALDRLRDACTDLSIGLTILLGFGSSNWEKVDPRFAGVNRAREDARASVARLRMRPHADPELVNRAEAAEGPLAAALSHMQFARAVVELDPQREAEARERLSKVEGLLDRSREEARAYETLAREAVAKLIGPEGSKQKDGKARVTEPAPP